MPSSALISMVTQSLRLSRHGPLVLILFIFRIHMFLRFWGNNNTVYMYFDTLLHPKRYVQISFVLTASHRGSKKTRKVYEMHHDSFSTSFLPCKKQAMTLQTPNRKLITNCFVQAYLEFEDLYSHRMTQLPCVWLSADHTFKVSANIGV